MTSLPGSPAGTQPTASRPPREEGGASRPWDAHGPVEAANGVRHWCSGSRPEVERGGDLYELPTTHDGIPHQIVIEPRPWWRGGSKVTALDAGGHPLKASLSSRRIRVVDEHTGLETVLDRNSLDLDVCGPRHSNTEMYPGTIEGTSVTDLEEHLAANGEVTIRTHHAVRQMVVTGGGAPTAMPGVVFTLGEEYEETVIPLHGPVSSRRVAQVKQQVPVETSLSPAHVEGDCLRLFLADGHEQDIDLPVPVHALAC